MKKQFLTRQNMVQHLVMVVICIFVTNQILTMVHMQILIQRTKIHIIIIIKSNHGRDFVVMKIQTVSVRNNGKYGNWNGV